MCVGIIWFWFNIVGQHACYGFELWNLIDFLLVTCNLDMGVNKRCWSVKRILSGSQLGKDNALSNLDMGGIIECLLGKSTLSDSWSGKPMSAPIDCWSGKFSLSNERSGKAHSNPNELSVGKGPWQAQQNVGREKYPITDKWSVG